MLNQGQVVNAAGANYSPGQTVTQGYGRSGEALVGEVHGRYYHANREGNLHYASNAGAGAAFTIFSNASFVGLAVWNPEGSGKNLSMVRAAIGVTGQASTAASGWGYAWLNEAGSHLATAAPVSAITAITATRGSCVCGPPGRGSSVALAASAATLTTAMAWGRAARFSTSTGAITVSIGFELSEDFDGTMIVPPGTFFALTSAILTGITAVGTLIWEELPV